jgi:hypothetical protein
MHIPLVLLCYRDRESGEILERLRGHRGVVVLRSLVTGVLVRMPHKALRSCYVRIDPLTGLDKVC